MPIPRADTGKGESPWRQKFGYINLHSAARSEHSYLAPALPSWLDPTQYATRVKPADIIQHARPIPEPTWHALDTLFQCERWQASQSGIPGLPMWQATALCDRLWNNIPSGQDPTVEVPPNHKYVFELNTATVCEQAWNPVFRRDKWLAFNMPITDTVPQAAGVFHGESWDVDCPNFWAEFSHVVELANRLLNATSMTPFLDALINSPRESLGRPPETIKHKGYNEVPRTFRTRLNRDPPEVLVKKIAALAKDIMWTFHDDKHTMLDTKGFVHNALTTLRTAPEDFLRNESKWQQHEPYPYTKTDSLCLVFLHTRCLTALLDPHSSASERCIARLHTAIFMLHELAHAINACIDFETAPRDARSKIEPSFDDHRYYELGVEMTSSLFEIQPTSGPVFESGDGQSNGYCVMQYGSSVPGLVRAVYPTFAEEPFFPIPGAIIYDYPIPPVWTSAVVCEDWWRLVEARYGVEGLRVPRILRSRTVINEAGLQRTYRARRQKITHPVAELSPQLRAARDALDDRKKLYQYLRPWYRPAYSIWQTTPYSALECRRAIELFLEHSRTREWRKAFDVMAEVYRGLLPLQAKIQHTGAMSVYPVFIALVGLMQITLPRARHEKDAINPTSSSVTKGCWSITRHMRTNPVNRYGIRKWDAIVAVQSRDVVDVHQPGVLPDRMMYHELDNLGSLGFREHIHNNVAQWWAVIEQLHPLPRGLSEAFRQSHAFVGRQLATQPHPKDWLDLGFVMPVMDGAFEFGMGTGAAPQFWSTRDYVEQFNNFNFLHLEISSQDTRSAAGEKFSGSDTASSLGIVAGPQPLPAYFANPANSGTHSPGHVDALPGELMSMAARVGHRPTAYYSIGMVADHVSKDSCWILADDEIGGFDVWDITDRLDRNNRVAGLTIHVKKTLYGRECIERAIPTALRGMDVEPIGKLLKFKLPAEVEVNDGKDGRPHWISLGTAVYDITDFPFESDEEQRRWCGEPYKANERHESNAQAQADTSASKKTPSRGFCSKAPLRNEKDFLSRLEPYKCGLVPHPQPQPNLDQPFTVAEVAWHLYPETGMYIILDDYVYDVGDYRNFHPGGIQILSQYAGRDATEAFKQMHPKSWPQILEAYEHLKIGRVVAEKGMSDLRHEIVLNGVIYDIRSLAITERGLYDLLNNPRLLGQDASNILHTEQPACLLLLAENLKLISGKIRSEPWTRKFPLADVRKHRGGKPGPANERVDEAWVTVNGYIYNVTAMIKYGNARLRGSLIYEAGREVVDESLREYLVEYHSCRIIGKVGDPDREEEDESDEYEDGDEDEPRETLARTRDTVRRRVQRR